jgi:cytochrome c553
MPFDMNDLLNMSRERLDALFAESPPGPIPNGDAKGEAIPDPGSPHARQIADFARNLWQGKTFDAQQKMLRNQVGPFGVKAIAADVYEGPSLFDGKPCIVLDYSKRSVVAEPIRDEIRLVAPATYLGRIYWNGEFRGYFALHLEDMAAARWRRRFRTLLALVIGIPLLIAILLAMRFLPDRPVTYAKIEDAFKYGSTGGERNAGFPLWVWKALPVVFADKLPPTGGAGYEAFGMVYENDEHGRRRDLPVGVMQRRNLGIDRVFVNCAVCHATTVRTAADQPPKVYVGLGAANFDLGQFEKFLMDIVVDERFTADVLVPAVEKESGGRLGLLDRYVVYPVAVALMRERLLMLRDRFGPIAPTTWGPGRVDTWNSAKAGLNFQISNLPLVELRGSTDFPSIWNQRKRKRRDDGQPMDLHWTGNNNDVNERNLSAAFGTGCTPATADHAAIGRLQDWLLDAAPPPFPFPIDEAKKTRGAAVYATYCAQCHGKSGQDFSGPYVGHVTSIREVGTDPNNWLSYTYDLSASQDTLYAGTPYRFKHFRKTAGYANAPLDGIWLRGPYLHNGSVPTLRDLLEPPELRPPTFYRGYDVIDPVKVGFRGDVKEENGRKFFLYDTRLLTNSNKGHIWGTQLPAGDKDAIVEYMKTF